MQPDDAVGPAQVASDLNTDVPVVRQCCTARSHQSYGLSFLTIGERQEACVSYRSLTYDRSCGVQTRKADDHCEH